MGQFYPSWVVSRLHSAPIEGPSTRFMDFSLSPTVVGLWSFCSMSSISYLSTQHSILKRTIWRADWVIFTCSLQFVPMRVLQLSWWTRVRLARTLWQDFKFASAESQSSYQIRLTQTSVPNSANVSMLIDALSRDINSLIHNQQQSTVSMVLIDALSSDINSLIHNQQSTLAELIWSSG